MADDAMNSSTKERSNFQDTTPNIKYDPKLSSPEGSSSNAPKVHELSRQESWKYLSTENSSLSTLEENHDVAHGLKWEMKENFLYDESSGADSGPSMADPEFVIRKKMLVSNDLCKLGELEEELMKLRLELKQTMEMYHSACSELTSEAAKARDIDQVKLEETQEIKEAELGEEAALALVEIERRKCKVAVEAAQKAQRLAEMEAQQRKHAEGKFRHEAEEKKKATAHMIHNELRYRKYTIEEIEAATDYFNLSEMIGEGGYGPVYKGYLDHTHVAIKALRPDISQGQKQFVREVEVLSSMRHPHLVILLGACPEYGCLVYEFLENGSLEDRLFRKRNTPPIPWNIRFKIAAEIATGLQFLHQAKPKALVHRDLKPANILLNRNYVSKIADVGLSRLVPGTTTTAAAGTFCYIDPEYQQTGKLGKRSDIYSLGMILLQIITARPPMGLSHHVEHAIENGEFEMVLDPSVNDWPVKEALSFARLALWCCELRRKDRPDLGSVILPELQRLANLENKKGGKLSFNK
ncbi:hypothetical protein Leryth_025184 [Lithospermum erythrorhizon]|nr:hypothetical protein Leryth_025184 [Lithospermum erythrorhizon]